MVLLLLLFLTSNAILAGIEWGSNCFNQTYTSFSIITLQSFRRNRYGIITTCKYITH